jgi:hypothetical protein
MEHGNAANVQPSLNKTCRPRSAGWRGFFCIVPTLCALLGQEAVGRQVEFASEEIELRVADSSCAVQGWYWFKNKSPRGTEIVLFYPFVVNERLAYPDTVAVAEGGSNRPIRFSPTKDGVYFSITVRAFATALYKVLYVQRTTTQSMEYLLRTTAKWKKPLEYGLYRVRVPEKYVLTGSTLLFSHMYKQNGEWIYEACKEEFMPSEDFIVRWQRRKP